ncbi:MAG: riboflavin biosynthesis protein RibF [Muribaculaceae bacterium]|nr:riboflavin biosynthesis protein RibF [Muribaculaceae bacterium]
MTTDKKGIMLTPGELSVVTVGTFDGVHRGHRAVLDEVRSIAEAEDLTPLAITFDRHPLEVIAPHRAPDMLTTIAERNERIQNAGVKPVIVSFTQDLRNTTAAGWMRRLHDDYGARVLVLGYDNTFGCDGLNLSTADYQAIGRNYGIRVLTAPRLPGCSSSAARKAVADGRMEDAREILGYDYQIEGPVVHGHEIGRTIGIPTANISVEPGVGLPAQGVYAADCRVGGRTLRAVVNVGPRPTVSSSGKWTVEAHLIGFTGELYGEKVRVHFLKRLRDTRKFPDLNALRKQIESDIAAALKL